MKMSDFAKLSEAGKQKVLEEIAIKKNKKEAEETIRSKHGNKWGDIASGLIHGDQAEDVFNARSVGSSFLSGATFGTSDKNKHMKGMHEVHKIKSGDTGDRIVRGLGEMTVAAAAPGKGIAGAAGYGAVSGGVKSYNKKHNLKEAGLDAVKGGIEGAAMHAVTSVASKAVRKAADKVANKAKLTFKSNGRLRRHAGRAEKDIEYASRAEKEYGITSKQAKDSTKEFTSAKDVNNQVYNRQKDLVGRDSGLGSRAYQRHRDLEARDKDTVGGIVDRAFGVNKNTSKRINRGMEALSQKESKNWEAVSRNARKSRDFTPTYDEDNSPLYRKLEKEIRGSALTDEAKQAMHSRNPEHVMNMRRLAQDKYKASKVAGGFKGDSRSLKTYIDNTDYDLGRQVKGYGTAKGISRKRIVAQNLSKSDDPAKYIREHKIGYNWKQAHEAEGPHEALGALERTVYRKRSADIIKEQIAKQGAGATGRTSTAARGVMKGKNNELFKSISPERHAEATSRLKNYDRHFANSQAFSRRNTTIDKPSAGPGVEKYLNSPKGMIKQAVHKLTTDSPVKVSHKREYQLLDNLPRLKKLAKMRTHVVSNRTANAITKIGGRMAANRWTKSLRRKERA